MPLKIATALIESWFTLPGQEDESNPARFKIKPLSQMDYFETLQGCQITESGSLVPSREALEKSLYRGITDWEGIQDQNGRDIKFTRTNFRHIPANVLSQLFSEILNKSEFDEEEEKN